MEAKRIKLADGASGNGGLNIPIRTLYVSPVNVDMGDQIKCYFERFGTVNSVKIEQEYNAGTHFALVEFEITDAAAAVLLLDDVHRVDDCCDVQVTAAEPWHQPDQILNALDDDCLREILLYLNQTDLTNAAMVCVRLNQQAKSVFSTKRKRLDLTNIEITHDEVINALHTFGSLAVSLKLNFNCGFMMSEASLADILMKNATSTMEHMMLMKGQIDTKTIEAISKMEHLKVLELSHIGGLTDEHLIQLATGLGSQLEKLHLENLTGKKITKNGLKSMLPFATKLSHLTLESTNFTINADDYKIMLATIQKRPEKIALFVELTVICECQVRVNKEVLEKNRNILNIDVKIDNDDGMSTESYSDHDIDFDFPDSD